ncbi:MAG: 4-alpha-glucanotransferase [Bacteroidota bacterium]
MNLPRLAGVLLHPTSLPSRYGIGDLGSEAFRFIEFLEASGQTIWQVLPLGPTGYGDSPYQCFSAFAGNPYLISPDLLMEAGLLTRDDVEPVPTLDPRKIDYGKVIEYKMNLFRNAYDRFHKTSNAGLAKEFDAFCLKHKTWLNDFSLFMALKEYHEGRYWAAWDIPIRSRKAGAVKEWAKKLSREIGFFKFLQFMFFRQWMAVKNYAASKGILIAGDIPIFIAFDSADAWSNRKLFTINEEGKPISVAGVPPDYFSPTGQLWGNPLYRWDEMKKDDYRWWRSRVASTLELFDILRIDHFRGFEAYWQIPGDAITAEHGKWVKGPGRRFFRTLNKHLGEFPIIAEDLGVITRQVEELRDFCGFPGMKILQFAFGSGMDRNFLPHRYHRRCVVYTGSHDNDTTRGFFEQAKKEANDIYPSARAYLNYSGEDIRFELIRAAYASVADMAIIPMQDILNLGSDARMNFPGTFGGNWTWRFTWDQVTPDLPGIYRGLALLYDRALNR